MQDIIKNVGTWAVIGLLGYLISQGQDRYTATTASNDIRIMREYISERIKFHIDRGPHDKVAERLLTIEIKLQTLEEKIDRIPRE